MPYVVNQVSGALIRRQIATSNLPHTKEELDNLLYACHKLHLLVCKVNLYDVHNVKVEITISGNMCGVIRKIVFWVCVPWGAFQLQPNPWLSNAHIIDEVQMPWLKPQRSWQMVLAYNFSETPKPICSERKGYKELPKKMGGGQ
jgi:hypothetical protein